MANRLRCRREGRGGGAGRSAHGLLLRPPRAGVGGALGLQARRGAQAPVPGQPLRADPRAELQADGRGGGVQQGAGHQYARQPRRAQPPAGARGGCARGGARAVPRRLLVRAHLRAHGAACAGACVRCGRAAASRARGGAVGRAVAGPGGAPARAGREPRGAARGQGRARRGAQAPAAEVAEAKQAAAAQPDTHDYSEAETRDSFIDLLLKEAGWPLD